MNNEKQVNQYISQLIENHNNTTNEGLKNLTSREEYFKILYQLLSIDPTKNFHEQINNNDDKLRKAIDEIVYQKSLTPGLILDYGTKNFRDMYICGKKSELEMDTILTSDTMYDLASTSKLFTTIILYYCYENNIIDFDKPLCEYDSKYNALGKASVNHFLKFANQVSHKNIINNTKNKEEINEILYNSTLKSIKFSANAYNDFCSIYLRDLIETITGEKFDILANQIIFNKSGMIDTHAFVPFEKIHKIAGNNHGFEIKDGEVIQHTTDYQGLSHDTKAKRIKDYLGTAPGHAGYFSTASDMRNLGLSLLEGKIISRDSLMQISQSTLGGTITYEDKTYYQRYFGSQCYAKQESYDYLSVYQPLSGRAFMCPGYAGTLFEIDPLNNLVLFIGANRVHNRIHKTDGSLSKEDVKINYDGIKFSNEYARAKEIITHEALNNALKYDYIENLYDIEESSTIIKRM